MRWVALLASLSLNVVGLCAAQSKCLVGQAGSVRGTTYSNSKLGLTYIFPESLTPDHRPPPGESRGRSEILLALSRTPREIKPNVILFIDDRSFYPDSTVATYLERIEGSLGSSNQVGSTREFTLSGIKFYRLDFKLSRPGSSPLYATSITGAIGVCQLSFQLTAGAQQDIDAYVSSVMGVKISKESPRGP